MDNPYGPDKHRIVVRNGHTGMIIFWARTLEQALKWIKKIAPRKRNRIGYWIEYWDEPARLLTVMSIAARATSFRLQKDRAGK